MCSHNNDELKPEVLSNDELERRVKQGMTRITKWVYEQYIHCPDCSSYLHLVVDTTNLVPSVFVNFVRHVI